MSRNKKKQLIKNIFTSNLGCGCGCGRAKPSEIFHPKRKSKLKPKTLTHQNPKSVHSSSSTSWERNGGAGSSSNHDQAITSATFSINEDESPHSLCDDSECPKIGGSVAVVKDSDDPYVDFRRSMIEMITEKEIRSKDELHELLNCLLHLNSPNHHEIIYRAFMDILE